MPNQSIPTRILVENAHGTSYVPQFSTSAASPSFGSILIGPPKATHLVGVDYQLTTFILSAGAGAYTSVTWPSIGFTGLLSAKQRIYTSGAASPVSPKTVADNTNPLVTGQSTQLCLLCNMVNYTIPTPMMLGAISITVQGNSTGAPQYTGPWFSSGTTYTSFSCTASTMIYTPSAVSSVPVSLGIAAHLYAVFMQ